MSKERLEEIVEYEHTVPSGKHYVRFKRENDYKQLILKAERVEKLEEENKELESLAKMQHDAKIEIEKRCLELEEKLKDQIDSNWKLDKINRMWLRENKRYREAIEKIKKKANQELEGLDAEEEMQKVLWLSELMTICLKTLEGSDAT